MISGVNQLILSAFQGSPPDLGEASVQGDLPWVQEEAGGERTSLTSPDLSPENGNVEQPVDDESQEPELALARASPFDSNLATCQRELNRRQLEMLAPILDRLGRALTDAAPHIASLAASLPEAEPVQNADNSSDVPDLVGDHHPPLGGLLSLLTRERNRRAQQSADQSPTSALDVEATRVSTIDPDHVDFASGLINTTRGEVRSGPRGRSQQDDMAGLLGAYLAAASLGSMTSGDPDNLDENGNSVQGLGRLLRDRGTAGGGGGIDIHIHAVVTAPGVTPGGLGFATLGGGGIVPGAAGMGTRNMFSSARERSRGTGSLLRSRHPTFASAIVNQDDDDWGLFSELYSENPVPVDPNGSPQPGERPERNAAGTDDSMQDDSDYLSRISSPRLGSGLAMRSDSLSLTTTRRSRRSNGSLARESSERSRGWGRLFRRRSRSSHRNGNGNQDST